MSLPWRTVTDTEEVEKALVSARDHPLVLFKHSPRCGVSFHVLDDLNKALAPHADVTYLLVDVVNNRSLSQWLVKRTGQPHQSPQLLVWQGEKIIMVRSHYAIRSKDLEEILFSHTLHSGN